MYKITMLLDEDRSRATDMSIDETTAHDMIKSRSYRAVFQEMQNGVKGVSEAITDAIYNYEIMRSTNRWGDDMRFSLGDIVVVEDIVSGERKRLFHCMYGNGYMPIAG